MDALRLYLLAGLLGHKAIWEVMKRLSVPAEARVKASTPVKPSLVKVIKVAILLGICAQTLLPPLLPISGDAASLRLWGAVIYTAGLGIAILGRLQLGKNWLDIEDAAVKRDQQIVDGGVYRYIRHPIYVGDLVLLLGLELALNSWLVLGVALLVPVVLRQAMREERLLAGTLPGYAEYCQRTKRFVPFVA